MGMICSGSKTLLFLESYKRQDANASVEQPAAEPIRAVCDCTPGICRGLKQKRKQRVRADDSEADEDCGDMENERDSTSLQPLVSFVLMS